MKNEIKLLKDKIDNLNDDRQTLDRFYTECTIENLNLQTKLDQCESGNHNGVICRKELELCRNELSDEQKSNEQLNHTLQNVEESLEAVQNENDAFQNQLTSEKAENGNLQKEIQKLKSEMIRMQSESSRRQEELKKELDFEKTTNSATIKNLNSHVSRLTDDIQELKNDKETDKFYFKSNHLFYNQSLITQVIIHVLVT